jgi:hypothetical protein
MAIWLILYARRKPKMEIPASVMLRPNLKNDRFCLTNAVGRVYALRLRWVRWCGFVLLCCAVSRYGRASDPEIHADGTASVQGTVEENNKGCARDAACYFKLSSGGTNIRVVYDPGEREPAPPNVGLVAALMKISPGTVISAYGAYQKSGSIVVIDVYSRSEYFVRVVPARK